MSVAQRRFPYPYKAMIAMSSDLEGTGLRDHERLHRFINTKTPNSETPFYSYDGLGVDWSDSFFFHGISYLHLSVFNPIYEFTDFTKYYNEDTSGMVDRRPNTINPITGEYLYETPAADYIEKSIRCGWINFLHGGHADNGEVLEQNGVRNWTRKDGELFLQWVEQRGLKGMIPVFINHSDVTADFGANSIEPYGYRIMGDDPNSDAYWSDLAIKSGIKYFWSYNPNQGAAYRTTIGRESMIEPKTFRDGNKYWHFSRYSSGQSTKGDEIAKGQLSQGLLNYIEENGLFEIAYSHFGVASYALDGNVRNPEIGYDTQTALKDLADRHHQGRICATKISRLLNYDLALHYLQYTSDQINGKTVINITAINDTQFGKFIPILEDLRGVTFYVPDNQQAEIWLRGKLISEDEITRNPADQTGKQSIGIKWFADDFTDYTKKTLTEVRQIFPNIDNNREPISDSGYKICIANEYATESITLFDNISGEQILIKTPEGIKGIDLVDISQPRASNIRIKTKDSIKSPAKF